MSTFNQAIRTQESRTANGMKALAATGTSAVDLFFKIGASRGKNIIPDFVAAFAEDQDLAVRITQWARDVRGGAGERQLFRDILAYLEKSQPATAMRLQAKVAEIGRWDDLLIDYTNQSVQRNAFTLIKNALADGNGLCAKWMPRKGMKAVQLRSFLGWSPKRYRKTLVSLTNVVETKMCDQKWDEINFSHVPSLASTRYKGAFYKNAEAQFTEYVDKLTAGDKSVKVNASTAVYPYDILKGVHVDWNGNIRGMSATEQAHVIAQWDALENFMGDANVFPMIDVSGSMTCPAGRNGSVSCMDVAVSLGLYCADKNTGKFKDSFLTFSESPQILNLRGNVIEKMSQVRRSDWGMNTDLIKAFREMLKMAKNGNVPQEEMPEMLLIMSDMQFDSCARFDDSAMQSIRRQYEEAGYSMPQIVFWNINSADNAPAKYDTRGVALVSGFSPAIMGSVLGADPDQFTPEAMMRKAVCIERYDISSLISFCRMTKWR
jgi:hypothetical protein